MRRPRKPEAGAAEADERTVRTAALALLTGRDFARRELALRLARRGYPRATIESVLDQLANERLQDDGRFVSLYVARQAGRGQGPARIRMELRERGIVDDAVDAALAASEVDWPALARQARQRRFAGPPPQDFRTRAKQARFLQYRGFSADQIRAALGSGPDPTVDEDRVTAGPDDDLEP